MWDVAKNALIKYLLLGSLVMIHCVPLSLSLTCVLLTTIRFTSTFFRKISTWGVKIFRSIFAYLCKNWKKNKFSLTSVLNAANGSYLEYLKSSYLPFLCNFFVFHYLWKERRHFSNNEMKVVHFTEHPWKIKCTICVSNLLFCIFYIQNEVVI